MCKKVSLMEKELFWTCGHTRRLALWQKGKLVTKSMSKACPRDQEG